MHGKTIVKKIIQAKSMKVEHEGRACVSELLIEDMR